MPGEPRREPEATAEPGQTTETMAQSVGAGERLKDRYLVERELGRGRDTQLHNKAVVVKILRDVGDDSEWSRRKFGEECEALARINHPGVVQVLDSGETSRGQPFLVMQFVEGSTLRTALGKDGMELERVAHLMEHLGQALTAAHNQGVCHRDLKPENIILCDMGGGQEMPIIIDFGIAILSQAGRTHPEATRVAGSYAYMAPEQMSGSPGPASDIFSLGVIAYEMATGTRPFKLGAGDAPVQIWFQQKEGVKTKPSDLRHGLASAAEGEILKALAFEPRERHAQACDFGNALAQALRAAAATAPQPVPAVEPRARSRFGWLLWYLIPSLGFTVLLRVFLDTYPPTRDWPLSAAETLVVFVAALMAVAVLRWLGRLLRLR